MSINRIRDLIDRYEHGPLVAALIIIELPLIVAMVITHGWTFAFVVIGATLLLLGWTVLILAALTKWFGR